jgi:hypothetical protein
VNFTKTLLPTIFRPPLRVASIPLTLPMPQKLRSLLDQRSTSQKFDSDRGRTDWVNEFGKRIDAVCAMQAERDTALAEIGSSSRQAGSMRACRSLVYENPSEKRIHQIGGWAQRWVGGFAGQS